MPAKLSHFIDMKKGQYGEINILRKSRSQLNGVRHIVFSFLTLGECVKKISMLNRQIRNELKSENE